MESVGSKNQNGFLDLALARLWISGISSWHTRDIVWANSVHPLPPIFFILLFLCKDGSNLLRSGWGSYRLRHWKPVDMDSGSFSRHYKCFLLMLVHWIAYLTYAFFYFLCINKLFISPQKKIGKIRMLINVEKLEDEVYHYLPYKPVSVCATFFLRKESRELEMERDICVCVM